MTFWRRDLSLTPTASNTECQQPSGRRNGNVFYLVVLQKTYKSSIDNDFKNMEIDNVFEYLNSTFHSKNLFVQGTRIILLA